MEPEIVGSTPVRQSDVIPAIRGWSLWPAYPSRPEEAVLASLVVSYEWEGPVVRAGKPSPVAGSLSYSPNSSPRAEVGFFGLKPESFHCDSVLGSYPSLACVGTVSLFGRVIEHEFGYRAEGARVNALWVIEERLNHGTGVPAGEVTRELERRYRCDAHLTSTFQRALEKAVCSIPPRSV